MVHALHTALRPYLTRLAIAFTCLLVTIAAKAQPAIPGYTGLGVYNGHYYYISETLYHGNQISMAVADARVKIQAIEPSRPDNQVYAAAILNMAENVFIQNAVLNYNTTKYGDGKSTFEHWGDPRNPWIGLTDVGTEGNFYWSNGQPNCEDFRNWNVGEPNNYAGPVSNGEDYTQMLIMKPYSYQGGMNDPFGKWNDWFNQDIIDPSGANLGPTKLPVIIEVGPRECITLNFELSGTTKNPCNAQNGGSASFTITSGEPPFSYSINNGAYSAGFYSNTFTVSNLAAGNYSIAVKDGNGATKTLGFTIEHEVCPPPARGSYGCSQGYWKSASKKWWKDNVGVGAAGYKRGDNFFTTFGISNRRGFSASLTLDGALNTGGGGYNNVLRQGVASLLNAAHYDVDFPYTEAEIKAAVKSVFETGSAQLPNPATNYTTMKTYDVNGLGSELDRVNNLGCPLDAKGNVSSSSRSTEGLEGRFPIETAETLEVKGFPNPTRGHFNLVINGKSSELVTIRVTDVMGRLIEQRSNIAPNQQVQLGQSYAVGMYNVEVVQGAERKQTRMIKNNF